MKKFIAFAVLILLGYTSFAQKVTEGSLDCLKGKKEIAFAFTYDNLMCGKMTEAEYVESKAKEKDNPDAWKEAWYKKDRDAGENGFKMGIDKALTKKTGVEISESAQYAFVIDTYSFDAGFEAGIVSRGVTVELACTLIDTQSKQTVAVIELGECKGAPTYSMESKKAMAYYVGAKKLAKFLIKQKAF